MGSSIFNQLLPVFFILLVLASSCKKDPASIDTGNTLQTPTDDRVALTNDSIFLYAKEIYYWNEQLPTYDTFNPRRYTTGSSNLANYEQNLLDLTEQHEGTVSGAPKFSYIEDVSDQDGGASAGIRNLINGVNLQGEGNDIGIYFVSAVGASDNDYELFIKAVYPGSPASEAGLTRAATITKINDTEIGSNFNRDLQVINNELLSDPFMVRLAGKRTDGSDYEVNLVSARYESSPIYKSSVIERNGENIGYLAYARFSDSDNSVEVLNEAFNEFAIKDVEDLIIDLRYNGGGYVSTAEHLINLIVPPSASGTMFSEHYNTMMQNGQAEILKNQPVRNSSGEIIGTDTYFGRYTVEANTRTFAKAGNLNGVKNVVFLVTDNTASSSELVINSLRSTTSGVTVQLVGTTTYGKPVGFFPVRIEGIYDLYLTSFSTKNAEEEGDYYSGFTPGNEISGTNMLRGEDDLDIATYDFGDERELYIAEALRLLSPSGSSTTSERGMMSLRGQQVSASSVGLMRSLGKHKEFKGMIETGNR
ncbi:hypothetical protein H8S90_17165 [Olivibacter sp. SDN3]|uniref:S41 family peptidase n=1 Tax=Olivibacter sp. SDN3 TaxID=2764720 RepID=UPI0016511C59|nr:S41 family peptidase [Olivibacter sp. SDN3]QNL48506.1 hypothetical protein H8S90_17165 [Olivibacter sp. SDN3]